LQGCLRSRTSTLNSFLRKTWFRTQGHQDLMGDKASAPVTCHAIPDQPLALIQIGAKSQDQAYKGFPVLWQP
jgi:hypothetical protein